MRRCLSGAENGGSGDGTVFEVVAGSNTITPLVSFNGTDGESPYAGLVSDGSRGSFWDDCIRRRQWFRQCVRNHGRDEHGRPIAGFHLSDGAYPEGALILDGSGNLYGTVSFGGNANCDGAIFELSPNATVAKLAFLPAAGQCGCRRDHALDYRGRGECQRGARLDRQLRCDADDQQRDVQRHV